MRATIGGKPATKTGLSATVGQSFLTEELK
jgi:hypothetical protein